MEVQTVRAALQGCVRAVSSHLYRLVDGLGPSGKDVRLFVCLGDPESYQPLGDHKLLSRRLDASVKWVTQAPPRHGKGN